MKLTVGDIAILADKVCGGADSWSRHFRANKLAMQELEDRPEYCLDLSFMYTLLRLGYEFEENREVTIAKQIDGTELGWALGAGIALVGASIECKA
jgi:guanosine-diphosphatase